MPSGLLSFKNKQKNIHFLKKEKKKEKNPEVLGGLNFGMCHGVRIQKYNDINSYFHFASFLKLFY